MNVAETALAQVKGGQIEKPKPTIFGMIEMQKKAFARLFADEKQADRFTRIAITALKSNDYLAKCEPSSILSGLMLSAQLGLEPNSPLHEATLIPYGNKAQFQIEYRGLLKLVWQSGLVKRVEFGMVCENDEYEYELGINFKFIHRPNMKEERGEPFIYYAYAELVNGGQVFHVMSKIEILEHAKKFSKTWNGTDFSGKPNKYGKSQPGPWDTDFNSMAIKTVLKILCDKKLPKRTTDEAIKFHKAIDRDEKVLPEIEISRIESTDFTEIPLPYAVDDSEIQDVFYSKETGEVFDGKN